MRLSPTLATLDKLNIDGLVVFLPANHLPLQGFLSLLDWRLCFQLSEILLNRGVTEDPVLLVDFKNLSFGRLFIFPCKEELDCKKKLDAKITFVLKVLDNAQVANFVFSFPDKYPWIFEHWQKNYEDHTVFKNISIIDRYLFNEIQLKNGQLSA